MNAWESAPVVDSWQSAPLVDAKDNPYQEPPGIAARVGRGMMDVGQGLKQLYLLATDKDAAAKYTAEKNDEEALYGRGRAKGQAAADKQVGDVGTLRHVASLLAPGSDPEAMIAAAAGGGPDVARFAGNVAATAPAMLVPGGAAPGLATRMLSQGAGGAFATGAMFDPSGTVGGKVKQAATGLGVGAFLPAAADVAGGVAGAAADLARPIINKVTGKTSDAAAATEVAQALNGAGIDFAALPAQVKASLTASAKDQLNVSGAIDVSSLLRKADIEAVGGTPTKGMLTREPEAWNFERETSKIRGPGDSLQDVFKGNNDALREQIPAMQAGRGAVASPYQAAESAREGVDAYSKGAQKATSDLYNAAKDAPGANEVVDGTQLFPLLQPILETFEDNISSPVKRRIAEMQSGERPTTIAEVTKLYQLVNDSMGGVPGKAGAAAGRINAALMDVASGSTLADTGAAADLFKQATASARDRFTKLEPTPIKALADTGEASPTFLQNQVLGGKPGELSSLKDMLATSKPDAWADIQHQTLEHLAQKAMGGDVAEGLFSGARFSKALAAIGDDRLSVIFSPQELAQLKQIERAAHAMTKEPPLSNVNHSNTASTLANLVGKVAQVPILGSIGALPLGFLKAGQDVVKEASMGRAARAAINPSAKAFTPGADSSAAMREFLARALRGWGAAGGAVNASPSGP